MAELTNGSQNTKKKKEPTKKKKKKKKKNKKQKQHKREKKRIHHLSILKGGTRTMIGFGESKKVGMVRGQEGRENSWDYPEMEGGV